MGRPVTEDEFLALVRGFRSSAFRLEAQRRYRLDYERGEFQAFIAGHPRSPDRIDWWYPWLERVSRFASEGRHISRVRILDEPPTEYQQWMLWADPWHAAVGEEIRYVTRSRAERAIPPLDHDWWLLDGEQVIVMRFTDDGEDAGKELVTDPVAVALYRMWQDVAFNLAGPAEQIAAA
jgi:uncharacterized protein DUF6879